MLKLSMEARIIPIGSLLNELMAVIDATLKVLHPFVEGILRTICLTTGLSKERNDITYVGQARSSILSRQKHYAATGQTQHSNSSTPAYRLRDSEGSSYEYIYSYYSSNLHGDIHNICSMVDPAI